MRVAGGVRNGPHSGARNSSFAMGTLRTDRFVGVHHDASSEQRAADFTTIALNVTGSKLIVSLDTDANGSVAVGAVGVPGLSLADATPLSATTTDAVVEFKGAKDFSIGKTVAFEVKMSRAAMFILRFL